MAERVIEETKVDNTVDITDVVCPVTFVKAKAALEELDSGQVLAIRMNDGEPVRNVPRSIKDEGYQILKLRENDDGTYTLIVKVPGPEPAQATSVFVEPSGTDASCQRAVGKRAHPCAASGTSASCASAERSIQKKFRKKLWTPFINAVKQYGLIQEGDRIAVCISGGKDSMLMAKLMQQLHRQSDFPFDLTYLTMDPGYNELNRRKIEQNAELLQIPITFFETNVFEVANASEKNPCYLCARMRRGHLYSKARELGCNKIALGHHFNDVIETVLLSMFYGAQLQCMPPKLRSTNFEGMELIRPLYCVHEDDIIAWRRYNELEFIQCACRFTENCAACGSSSGVGSKRQEVKQLLKRLKRDNPDIEKCVFKSLHAVNIDTFPGWKAKGVAHSFLESYS